MIERHAVGVGNFTRNRKSDLHLRAFLRRRIRLRLLIDSAAPDEEESDVAAEEITVVARSAVLTKSVIEAPPP